MCWHESSIKQYESYLSTSCLHTQLFQILRNCLQENAYGKIFTYRGIYFSVNMYWLQGGTRPKRASAMWPQIQRFFYPVQSFLLQYKTQYEILRENTKSHCHLLVRFEDCFHARCSLSVGIERKWADMMRPCILWELRVGKTWDIVCRPWSVEGCMVRHEIWMSSS